MSAARDCSCRDYSHAISEGHSVCVERLIKAGVDVNQADGFGDYPVFCAFDLKIKSVEREKILEMLLKEADLHVVTADGFTTLMAAAEGCDDARPFLRLILEAGVSVNGVDSDGSTALMHAVGKAESMAFLIDSGADVNMENANGDTSLMLAAGCGATDCVQLLIKAGANVNALHPVDSDDEDDDMFYTALMKAATRSGETETVKVLIDAGADVNASRKGITALREAARCGASDCAELLIKSGAFLNVGDSDGNTALMHASRNSNSKCVKTLLDAGAIVNAANCDGYTALMWASLCGVMESVEILIEAGADVNAVDKEGNTALIRAVQCRFYRKTSKKVRLLLEAGAKINIKSPYNADFDKREMRLLVAAGEKLPYSSKTTHLVKEEICLKAMCRETIRNRLIKMDPHTHLFRQVHDLALPSAIKSYLLHDVSLSDNE